MAAVMQRDAHEGVERRVPGRQPAAARVGDGLVGKHRFAAGEGGAKERAQVGELQALGGHGGKMGLAGCVPSDVGDGVGFEIGLAVSGVQHLADEAVGAGAERQQALEHGRKTAAALGRVEQVQGQIVTLRQLAPLGLQLGLCAVGQIAQGGALRGAEQARASVLDAQHAHGVAAIDHQRGAGVVADVRLAGDHGVVGEARVLQGVGDFENARLQNGVAAKRDGALGFGGLHPQTRLEPLTLGVHQGNQSDRHIEQGPRQPGDAVEALFGGAVEHPQRAQGAQALRFAVRQSGGAIRGAGWVHTRSETAFRFGKW